MGTHHMLFESGHLSLYYQRELTLALLPMKVRVGQYNNGNDSHLYNTLPSVNHKAHYNSDTIKQWV